MHLPARLYQPVRLKRSRRWLVYGIGFGLWSTGAAWLAFHYFLKVRSDFGPAENSLTHWWLAAHGLFAFASLWLFGLLWGQHFVGAWKDGRHRFSGGILFAIIAVLIASGYLLYYAGGDSTQAVASMIHWGIGLAVPLPFLVHRFIKVMRAQPRGAEAAEDDGITEGLV